MIKLGYAIKNPRVSVDIERDGVTHTIVKELTVQEFLRADWRDRNLATQCVEEFKVKIGVSKREEA